MAAEAARNIDYLRELLAVPGGDVLGEIGIGLNYEIDRFTLHTLLDEKIGGTVHVAPGNSFARACGRNRSAIHVDMVCDLRADGEIYGDGELIWRAGRFVDSPRASLRP